MAVIQATNKSNAPELEDDIYEFVVQSVEDAESNGDPRYNRDNLPRQVLTYRLAGLKGDDGKPITVRQWVTLYNPMRKKSAVYGVFAALMYGGEQIPEGDLVDTDDLVGKRGRLVWGDVTTQDNQTKKGIVRVMPPTKQRKITADDIDSI